MIVKTKYDIGDTVFYMQENKVCSNKVDTIEVHIDKRDKELCYTKYCGLGKFTLKEHQLFLTKEELIKSL